MFRKVSLILTILSTLALLETKSALAQEITVDGSTATIVTEDGNRITIDGNTLSQDGKNLFHSFQEFGLSNEQIATFLTNPNIQNILTRITGGNPSYINGLIEVVGGNSNLFIMNPAGVIFGNDATLNVPADFTATSATGIGFPNGIFNAVGSNDYQNLTDNPTSFIFNTDQPGSIVNSGNLTVTEGSNVTLVGGNVINTGTIETSQGKINIQAVEGTSRVKITPQGSLLSLEVTIPLDEQGNSLGFTPEDLPELLTGGDNAGITTTGIGVNPTSGNVNVAEVDVPKETGITVVSGKLEASSNSAIGGDITILGNKVALVDADVNANGATGGGEVLIGGDYQGKGTMPQSSLTVVDQNSQITANATSNGDGGTIVVWSNGNTAFTGNIEAKGDHSSGDGGVVEVSGKQNLFFDGQVDTTAANGKAGSLLLDPRNVTIVNGSGASDDGEISDGIILKEDGSFFNFTISENALEALSGKTNVLIEANNDITIEDLADNQLTFQPNITQGTTPRTSVTFNANTDGGFIGDFSMDVTDTIVARGRDVNISAVNISVGAIDTATPDGNAGDINLNAQGGDINVGGLFSDSLVSNGIGGDISLSASLGNINIGNISAFGSVGGDLTLVGNFISQTQGTSIKAGNNLIFKATNGMSLDSAKITGNFNAEANRSIQVNEGANITTSGGNIIFNSDRDSIGGGFILIGKDVNSDDVVLPSTLDANGGDIILGGGANPLQEAAIGVPNTGINPNDKNRGISLINTSVMTTGSGNISLRGTGLLGNGNDNVGIFAQGNTTIQSQNGNITFVGVGQASGELNHGINLGSSDVNNDIVEIEATGSGNINLTGNHTGNGTDSNVGIITFGDDPTNPTRITSNTGAIILNGSTTASSVTSRGISVQVNSQINSTGGGNTNINATSTNHNDGFSIFDNGRVVTSGTTIFNTDNDDINTSANSLSDFGSVVITSARNVSLSDANDVDLGLSNINGDLSISAGGNITDSNTILVSGETNLDAINNIFLDSSGNDFNNVNLKTANNVILVDSNDLTVSNVDSFDNPIAINILGDLQLDVIGNATIAQNLQATNLVTASTGTTIINGSQISSTNDQTYNNRVVLKTDTSLRGNNISFNSSIDSLDNPYNLDVTALNNLNYGDGMGDDRIGANIGLNNLNSNSSQTTNLNIDNPGTSINTTGEITFNNPVNLKANTTVNGNQITFNNTLDGDHNLAIISRNNTNFQSTIGGVIPLGELRVTANNIIIGSKSVTTNGTQEFNGDISLNTLSNNGDTTTFITTDSFSAENIESKERNLIIEVVGDVQTSRILTEGNNLEITTEGEIVANDVLSTTNGSDGGDVSLNAGENITLDGGIITVAPSGNGGDINLNSTNGSIKTNGSSSSGNPLDASGQMSGGNINLQTGAEIVTGDLRSQSESGAGGAIKLRAEGNIQIDSNNGIVLGSNSGLTSGDLTINSPANLSLAGNIFTNGANFQVGNESAPNEIIASDLTDINTSDGNLDFQGGKIILVEGEIITQGGDVRLQALGNLELGTINTLASQTSGGDLEVKSKGITIFNENISANNLTTDIEGETHLNTNITTIGNQTYNDQLILNQTVVINTNNLTVVQGININENSPNPISLTINANDTVAITGKPSSLADNSVNLAISTARSKNSSGDVIILAENDINIDGIINTAAVDLNLTDLDDLSTNGGHVTINSLNGNVSVSGIATFGSVESGDVELNALGNLRVGPIITLSNILDESSINGGLINLEGESIEVTGEITGQSLATVGELNLVRNSSIDNSVPFFSNTNITTIEGQTYQNEANANDNIIFTSNFGDLDFAGDISGLGTIDLITNQQVNTANINSRDRVTISSSQGVNTGDITTTDRSINIVSPNRVPIQVNTGILITQGGSVNIDSGKGTIINQGINTGNGSILLIGNEIDLVGGDNTVQGASVSFLTGNNSQNIRIGDLTEGDDTTLDLTFNDLNALADGFSLISVSSDNFVSSNNSNLGQGNITIVDNGSPLNIKDSLSFVTGGNITLENPTLNVDGSVNFQGDNQVNTLAGTINSTSEFGSVNITSSQIIPGKINSNFGGISLNGDINLQVDTILKTGGDITFRGDVTGYENLTLEADGSVTTQKLDTSGEIGGNIQIDARGDVEVATIDTRSSNGLGGNITINTFGRFRATDIIPGTLDSINASGSSGGGNILIDLFPGGLNEGVTEDPRLPFVVGNPNNDITQVDTGTVGFIRSNNSSITNDSYTTTQTANNITINLLKSEKLLESEEAFNTTKLSEIDKLFIPADTNSVDTAGLSSELILNTSQARTILTEIEKQTAETPAFIYVSFTPKGYQPSNLEADFARRETAKTQEYNKVNINKEGLPTTLSLQPQDDDILDILILTAKGDPVRITVPVTRKEVVENAANLWETLADVFALDDRYKPYASNLYNWLIQPLEAELEKQEISNLVFFLPTEIRFTPVAALYDTTEEKFLVEEYSSGLAPSLNLNDNRYRPVKKLNLLAMGASNFADPEVIPLPAAGLELPTIRKIWNDQVPEDLQTYVNDNFTLEQIKSKLSKQPYGIVHFGTHGEFNPGQTDESFIQLYNSRLGINEIRSLGLNNPLVELMVLSACETAFGNEIAELGFAGLAVKAGVKTAMGSVWQVSDTGTLALMTDFYSQLKAQSTKAEALRQAQLNLLQKKVYKSEDGRNIITPEMEISLEGLPKNSRFSEDFSHPFYWAPFTMIGNPW